MKKSAQPVPLDILQSYTAKGADLFPSLQAEYNQKILDLHHRGIVTILPQYYGEIYSKNIRHNIQVLLSKVS